MRLVLAACALGALTSPLFAQLPCGLQGVTASATPSTAQVGQTISVALNNGSPSTIQLPSSCVISSVFQGTCSGPTVWAPFCLQVITPIAPGTSNTQGWDQTDFNGQQVAPGTYSIEIRYFDANGSTQSCCLTVTITSDYTTYGAGCAGTLGVPTLSGSGTPSAGNQITLSGGNAQPNAPLLLAVGYGTSSFALSPTCNGEIAPLAGVLVPLTMDGAGTFALPVTIPPLLQPTLLTVQYLAVDVTFPPSFLTVSNALAIQTS